MKIVIFLLAGFVMFCVLWMLSLNAGWPWHIVPGAYLFLNCCLFGLIDWAGRDATYMEERQKQKRNRSLFYTRRELHNLQKRQAKSEVLF